MAAAQPPGIRADRLILCVIMYEYVYDVGLHVVMYYYVGTICFVMLFCHADSIWEFDYNLTNYKFRKDKT